jgi:hypothetical protein
VKKEVGSGRTRTVVRTLDSAGRVEELADMIGASGARHRGRTGARSHEGSDGVKPLVAALEPYLSGSPGAVPRSSADSVSMPVDREIGEAWVVSAVPGKASRVVGTGRTLDDLWRGSGPAPRAGHSLPGAPFPFLVKLLATEALSVQVHPTMRRR